MKFEKCIACKFTMRSRFIWPNLVRLTPDDMQKGRISIIALLLICRIKRKLLCASSHKEMLERRDYVAVTIYTPSTYV